MSTPLNPLDFRTLPLYLFGAIAVGLGVYLLFGYYLYRRYYLLRKDDAAAWKCQPKRFPNAEMRAYDLNLGIKNIVGASLVSGGVAWYLSSGRGGVYLDFSKHGVAFSLCTALAYFLGTDYALYWAHRLYHRPALFRKIHRWHHRNTTPTPFTAFAMHPVEFMTYECIAVLPLLIAPVYFAAAIFILLFNQIIALIQHSGVRMPPLLPFLPMTMFHDDHHHHFHVNYGQNLSLWDRLHGSLRRHDRRYGVEVFGGQGAPRGESDEAPRYIDYHRRDPEPSLPATAD